MFWFEEMPWFSSFLENISSKDSLWDWRLLLAVFLWCLAWSVTMVIQAIALTDSDIVSIYSSSASKDDPKSQKQE
jgi:hypothetical protein